MLQFPCEQFTFLEYTFRLQKSQSFRGTSFQSFTAGVSLEADPEDAADDQALEAAMAPPPALMSWRPVTTRYCEDGRTNYGHFNKTALRRVFVSFEAALARWTCGKYKKLARHLGRSYL